MNRNYNQQINVLPRGLVCIMGAFKPNGASAIDNTVNKGLGFTAARTAAGDYTLTLSDPLVEIISATLSLQLGSGDVDQHISSNAITPSAGTITMTVMNGATPQDVAAHANNWIHFCVWGYRTQVNAS